MADLSIILGVSAEDVGTTLESLNVQLFLRKYADSLAEARHRRIDVVRMDDSTGLLGGKGGWSYAFAKAMANEFGEWASPVYPFETASRSFQQQGYDNTGVSNDGTGGSGTPPSSDWDDYEPFGTNGDIGMYHATDPVPSNGNYVILSELDPMDGMSRYNRLMYSVSYGTFATGSGTFQAGARRNESPFNGLATGDVISTNTGSNGIAVDESLIVPADTRDYPISFGIDVGSAAASAGPTLFLTHRIVDIDATNGISQHSLYSEGGQSLYDMANFMQSTARGRFVTFFGELRRQQLAQGEATPSIWISINSGHNDQNETDQPSLGPDAVTDADSPAAYIDNMKAIIREYFDLWQSQGWDWSEVKFLLSPSNEVASDAELAAYRSFALAEFFGRNGVEIILWPNLITWSETDTNDWEGDGVHHTSDFYVEAARRYIATVPE